METKADHPKITLELPEPIVKEALREYVVRDLNLPGLNSKDLAIVEFSRDYAGTFTIVLGTPDPDAEAEKQARTEKYMAEYRAKQATLEAAIGTASPAPVA